MNYNEILEVLKKIYKEVDQFATEELIIPGDFIFSQEYFSLEKKYKSAWQDVKDHPGYNDPTKRDDSWERICAEAKSIPSIYTLKEKEYLSQFNLGEFKVVDKYGGEGKGESWHRVFHFTDHDVYIHVNGYYTSYDGVSFYNEWDCCSEVKPVTKTVVVYEA